MNIGIVTTWFERGAAYVSKQYMEVLQKEHNVFIFARSGESYATGNPNWDLHNVYWSKKLNSPFTVTVIEKKEFTKWIEQNKIDAVIFNEQHWWEPLIWCEELKVKTIAYIDYYTEQTVPLFEIYDMLICNTKKHLETFKWHPGAKYIPWGTDLELYKPNVVKYGKEDLVFFHSCGMDPKRKGTDLLIKAIRLVKGENFKLIIHTQVKIQAFYPELVDIIDGLITENKLEIIEKTVPAPGLFYKGDIYVYPSRLEGIGLTVVEAIASGLGVIVPDCGPMNEFVDPAFGKSVKIAKLFSRHDGYYWPQNEVEIDELAGSMQYYVNNKQVLPSVRKNARNYAISNLDWSKNAIKLNTRITELILDINVSNKQISIKKIIKFENYGLRKYNKYYLKLPYIFSLINILKKK